MRMSSFVPLIVIGCSSAVTENSETQYGPLLAETVPSADGLLTTLADPSGRVLAKMEWSRATNDASIDIHDVRLAPPEVHASNLSPLAANELLHRIHEQSTKTLVRDRARSAYTTCKEVQVCDAWEMFDMNCAGCATVASDCSVTVAYTCGN